MEAAQEQPQVQRLHALLSEFASREIIKPGLERIEHLCRVLGNPQAAFKAIHVAGTNGKGSVVTLIASGLMSQGMRVGTYTSPHLVHWMERICVGSTQIPVQKLLSLIEHLAPEAKRVAATVFELVTAAAFAHFAEQGVEVAVVETGLGGRFDATNLVQSILCVITGIGIDHTEHLGHRVQDIAWEKAGIIKPGVPLVGAPLAPQAQAVVAQECQLRNATQIIADPLVLTDVTFEYQWMAVPGHGSLPFRLLGVAQTQNVSTAICALRNLKDELGIDEARWLPALQSVRWAGRFEWIRQRPYVLLDGAHNPQGTAALVQSLNAFAALLPEGAKRVLMFGVRREKDVAAMAAHLFPCFDRVLILPLPSQFGLDPMAILPYAQGLACRPEVCTDVAEGLERFFKRCEPTDFLCVAGSLYLVGEVRWRLLTKGD